MREQSASLIFEDDRIGSIFTRPSLCTKTVSKSIIDGIERDTGEGKGEVAG
jgi:hypothetical protein